MDWEKFIKWTVLTVLFGLIPLSALTWSIMDLHDKAELFGRLWPLLIVIPIGIYALIRSIMDGT